MTKIDFLIPVLTLILSIVALYTHYQQEAEAHALQACETINSIKK
jgi:hypothetical protein